MQYTYYFAIFLALFVPQIVAKAQDLPGLIWSDRVSKETTDGDILETAPYVEIGTVRLSRFSQMQALTLQDILTIGEGDDVETLFVFRAWQGGASQGEQLMLVTASQKGVDVIGPFEQGFETMKIRPATVDFGPVFELYGADKNKPIERLEYFDGQLIEIMPG